MIQGYFDQPSAYPGDTITVRVSTDAPQFRIDFYRQGAVLDLVQSTTWMTGVFADEHVPWDDWGKDGTHPDGGIAKGWTGYPFSLAPIWVTGVYIAMFVEGDGLGNPRPPLPTTTTADARAGKALLVVKNPHPGVSSQLLYKLPLFTYQAYNFQGRGSIYQGVDVTLRRPGGGTGGSPWDSPFAIASYYDPFDLDSPRQVFAHWDAKLIAWLEREGYRADYCTDWDLHQDDAAALLMPYAVILSVGHDEYYSIKMRQALETYLANGGNIAFFSGNTCWWRAEFDPADPFRLRSQSVLDYWHAIGEPEDSLTGVSSRHAGWKPYKRRDERGNPLENGIELGYTVQRTDLWPFEGTTLVDGDRIGESEGLVGYESDGCPYDAQAPKPFSPDLSANAGTPSEFVILGTADLAGTGFDLYLPQQSHFAATMGMYSATGTVFTGATTDWARVVATGDPRVAQITRNVIDRLGGNPKGFARLGAFGSVVACDGFFTPDDARRHAIVGTSDGRIIEVFFHPKHGQGQVTLATHPGLHDVAAFWSADDAYRHVITCTMDGDIREIFFHPAHGQGISMLGNIPGAFRVAGFFSDDDARRHAIVATSAGEVFETFFHPDHGQGKARLGVFPGLVDIGAFYTPDDCNRHVIVGQSDGTVTEIYFRPQIAGGQVVLGMVAGLTRLSGYDAADDKFFRRRAMTLAGQDQLHEFRFDPRFGIVRAKLFRTPAVDVGAFFSIDDGYRHGMIAGPPGELHELFFRP